ncbi:MAG: HyaD/HybD family hydrogenase maturation endopeptidase [Deltaproteobacteria bacterium]|nr:HyaD/HybD family hydrogenase maturation endopeptidase [Deltaproteobacteria bacterium]
MEKGSPKILVLGIGNLLLRDEGVGIHVVNELHARYQFSENVSLVDGGTLGSRLIGIMSDCEELIVVDAVKNSGAPGSLYRLEGKDLRLNNPTKNSLHEASFLETLLQCQILGYAFQTVIIGVEPEDLSPWSDELTATVKNKVPDLMRAVLEEITRAGGFFTPLPAPADV